MPETLSDLKPKLPKINHTKLDGTEQSTKWQQYVFLRIHKEELSNCWLWEGNIGAGGYGTASVNRLPVYAHRLSWSAFVGKIPTDKILLHKCNVKRCVNPKHLRTGSVSENAFDAIRAGSMKPIPLCKSTHKGSKHGRSKLKEEDIPKIFNLYKSGLYQREIAYLMGVHRGTISGILGGFTWKHLDR